MPGNAVELLHSAVKGINVGSPLGDVTLLLTHFVLLPVVLHRWEGTASGY